MNKKTFNEMVARKRMLEGKIAALREHKKRNTISFLIESELEKAELVLAAKGIVDKIGKMAETMLSIESDDIMPMLDSLKDAYGPQMAAAFQKMCTDRVRAATASLTQTKDAIGAEVSKLEGVFNGGGMTNDMAATEFDAPAEVPAEPVAPEAVAAPVADDAAPAADSAEDADIADFFNDSEDNTAAGRARKESFKPKGKNLTEGLMDGIRAILTANFDVVENKSPRETLEALKTFITAADYEIASQFPDQLLKAIFDQQPAVVAPDAMGGLPMADPMDADMTADPMVEPDMNMDGDYDDVTDPLGDVADPYADPMSDPLADPLSGGVADSMDDPYVDEGMAFESTRSPVRRLRESKNPDAMIVGVFNQVVQGGFSPRKAAQKVAETFKIDLADVIAVITEAKVVKPVVAGKDWAKLYKEAKDEGLVPSAIVAFIVDNATGKPERAAIKAWVDAKKVVKEGEVPEQFKKFVKGKKADEAKGDRKDVSKKDDKKGNPFAKKDDKDVVEECDTATGFDVLNKDKPSYPTPSNPAVMTKSTSKAPTGKSPVVGGKEPTGNLKTVGNMAEAAEPKAAKPYHLVVSREEGKKWGVQFGAFDKRVATEEMAELKRSSKDAGYKEEWKVVTVADSKQKTSNEAVAKLNETTSVKKK